MVSAKFTPFTTTDLTMSGGPYGNNAYQLIQMHLHWGCGKEKGSEHAFDGIV
jgi:hypothetical protein